MIKQEVAELKKRMKKDKTTIQRVAGCYVNGEKEKLVTFNENFLSLEEDDMFKYLDLAKKSLNGKIGNNLLELEFPMKEEEQGGAQANLLALKKSELKNDDILNAFYDRIIEKYAYVGNYLILVFYDVYDVPKKGKDNKSQGESEEVYDYIICTICHVDRAKDNLGYTDEGKIGIVEGAWITKAPDTAFLFPAFNDRSSDIHATLFYTKDTMEPHVEIMEEVLNCKSIFTADMIRDSFNNIIANAVSKTNNEEEVAEIVLMVHKNLNDIVEMQGGGSHTDTDEHDILELDEDAIDTVAEEMNFDTDVVADIKESFKKTFGDNKVYISKVVDTKLLSKNALRIENIELRKQVNKLTKKDN